MELFDDYIRDWALAERYLWRKHGIECRVEQGDLAEEPIPTAQWVIGIHPEVTKGGPWFRALETPTLEREGRFVGGRVARGFQARRAWEFGESGRNLGSQSLVASLIRQREQTTPNSPCKVSKVNMESENGPLEDVFLLQKHKFFCFSGSISNLKSLYPRTF